MKLNQLYSYSFIVLLCMSEVLGAGTSVDDSLFQITPGKVTTVNSHNNLRYLPISTTLTASGTYVVNQNISFDPTGPNEACITIDADDVVLDFNLKSMRQAVGNTQPGAVGIRVAPHRKNIVVRNGSINNMTGMGIHILEGCKVINIFDLSIIDAGECGFHIEGTPIDPVYDALFSNILVVGAGTEDSADVCGFRINNASVLSFNNCVCSNSNPAGNFYGVKIANCSSVRFLSCIVADCGTQASEIVGFDLQDCNTVSISKSLAVRLSNTSVSSPSAVLAYRSINSQVIVFEENTAAACQASELACGFLISNGQSCGVRKCIALANVGGVEAFGFCAESGIGSVFQECEAVGNRGATLAAGFAFLDTESSFGVLFSKSFSNLSGGISAGIYCDTATNGIMINNQIRGHSVGAGYGILDTAGASTTSKILSNISMSDQTAFSPGHPIIPVYSGDLNGNPGTFENVAL